MADVTLNVGTLYERETIYLGPTVASCSASIPGVTVGYTNRPSPAGGTTGVVYVTGTPTTTGTYSVEITFVSTQPPTYTMSVEVLGSTTYYATVEFNANGGSGAPSPVSGSSTTTKNISIRIPSTEPTRSGYDFLGWADNPAATSAEFTPGSTIVFVGSTEGITYRYYAVWDSGSEERYSVTVTFNANGGSGAPSPITKYSETTVARVTLPTTRPTKSGSTFQGWATSSTASSATYIPGNTYGFTASEYGNIVQMYAVWTKDVTYIISASAATGGTITPSGDVIVGEGDDQIFAISTATSTDYTIDYLMIDGEKDTSAAGSTFTNYAFRNVTESHTIRAVFASKEEENPDEDDPEEDTPSGGTAGKCYLAYYETESATPTAVLNLPNIQSIEMQDNATITEISTIVYGFDDNFVMDTGTVRKYTVTCRRVQPTSVNNNASFDYQDRWSNGFWFTQLKRFFARWQNLNYGVMNNKVARTGGYRFHFEPGSEDYRSGVSYSDLYPTVDYNVFVLGAITSRYSGNNLQYLEVSIPLTVGSMIREVQEAPGSTVRLSPGSLSGLNTITMKVPTGISYPAPNTPKQWLANKFIGVNILKSWNSGAYYPGQLVSSSVSTLTATWTSPIKVQRFTGTYEVVTFDGEGQETWRDTAILSASKMRIWAISGGGGGATGQNDLVGASSGGGGGSGGFLIQDMGFSTRDLVKIKVTVGSGGEGGTLNPFDGVHEDGYDGEDTTISLVYREEVESDDEDVEYIENDLLIANVPGGKGGSWSREIGRGGAGSSENGVSGGNSNRFAGGDGGAPIGLESSIYINSDYTIPATRGGKGRATGDGGDASGYGGGGAGGGYGGALTELWRTGGDGTGGYVLIAFYR